MVQQYLLKKRSKQDSRKLFFRKWKTFYRLYKKHLNASKVKQFLRAGLNILDYMDTAFEGCEVLTVEEKLCMPLLPERTDLDFLGFIDLVMFKNDQLLIADLKTTGSTYMFQKYMDDMKKHQLTLYKQYYAKKHDIDPADIDVAYITLEKSPTSKQPIQFLSHHAGVSHARSALKVINNTLDMMDANYFPKNLESCVTKSGIRCDFYETEHCPA